LVEFRLEGCSFDDWRSMPISFTGLKSLSLNFMKSNPTTDETVREILLNLRNLNYLNICCLNQFSGTSIRDVISPSLTELRLVYCHDIKYGGLCAILSNNLSNLRSLELMHLPLFSTAGNGEENHLPSLPSSLTSLSMDKLYSISDKD
jgi:hypothetical protein